MSRKPILKTRYSDKTDAELQYIVKDAREAADAMKGWNPHAELKYLDQVNDASTEIFYRKQRAEGKRK